jgi:hypothetical protein
MRYFLLILLSCLSLPVIAQFVENVPVKEFREFPQAELKFFSIGNYGFGRLQNEYNPYYYWDDSARVNRAGEKSNIFLSLGGNLNIAGSRSFSIQSDQYRDFNNQLTFRPYLAAKIWYRYFLLQLNYTNDYLLHKKHTGVDITYNFDPFDLIVTEQEISVEKTTFMAALSMMTSPTVSLTIGALSSSFNYTWTPNDLDPVEFRSGLFNNLQYLFAATFKIKKRLQSYLMFKTQKANVALPEGNLKLSNVTITFPAAKVSYYGTVGYGILWQTSEQLNLSLEMRHQFLEAVDTTRGAVLAGSDERHIWNNEIILGTGFKVYNQLKIGALFSYYLNYDNNLDIRYLSGQSNGEPVVSFARITNPYSLVISGEYFTERLVIRGFYQYSRSSYQDNGATFLDDSAHYIAVRAGYYFSL